MRKTVIIALTILAALAVGGVAWKSGRDSAPSAADPAVVIGDTRFALQLQDMTVNTKNYAGKTVRMEGFTLPLKNVPWRFAVARIFICCGADGFPIGLPCEYADEMPNRDAWIEVEGKFRIDEQDRPYLEIVKLTVKATEGQRGVSS